MTMRRREDLRSRCLSRERLETKIPGFHIETRNLREAQAVWLLYLPSYYRDSFTTFEYQDANDRIHVLWL